MAGLSTEDHVTSVFVATLFFGIYLCTLFSCLRWLLFADEGWRLRKNIDWVIVIIAILLCCFSAANLGLSFQTVRTEIRSPPPPAKMTTSKHTTPAPDWVSIFDCTTTNISALLADMVLIHRCWLTYEKSYRAILLPVFFWLGGLTCTILQAYWQIIQKAGLLTAFQPIDMQIGPGSILTAFWGCTIILNAYATLFIAHRLWLHSKRETDIITPYSSLRFVARVITESGLLYLTITIIHLVVWFTPSTYAISVVSNINLPIIGIAYNLIIIRTFHKRADEDIAYRNQPHETSIEFAHTKEAIHSHFTLTDRTSSSETVTNTARPTSPFQVSESYSETA